MTMALAELVVFDFDGTVVDTEWPHYWAVREAYASFGLELRLGPERPGDEGAESGRAPHPTGRTGPRLARTSFDWQHRVGRADQTHWTTLLQAAVGRPIDVDAVLATARAAKHDLTLAEPMRPGVMDVLTRADRAGVGVAIASSSPRSWVEENLDRLGIAHLVQAVRTRDDVARAKPWPDVYAAACAALGASPDRAVAIEDSHHGCTAAVRAGLPCVVAPNRVTEGQDFSHALAVVPSLAHVTPGQHGLP